MRHKLLIGLASLLMLGTGAISAGAATPSVTENSVQPEVVDLSTMRADPLRCPLGAVCFYEKEQFEDPLVYYYNPVQHTCGNIPNGPALSVVNRTDQSWYVYSDLKGGNNPGCTRDRYEVKRGEAVNLKIPRYSWS